MNRFTKKQGEFYVNNIDKSQFTNNEDLEEACIDCTNAIYQRYGQIEDIEEELGIDLITLFKLSKAKNVYAYGFNGIIKCTLIGVDFKEIVVWSGATKTLYQLCDYGKSFALTQEELEQ